jgi:hypothetical protein
MLIGIIIGFIAGTATGIFTMCIVSAGRENERLAEQYREEKDREKDEIC